VDWDWFLFSVQPLLVFHKSHEFLNLVQDQQVHPEGKIKEQSRQRQNNHQISTIEFFQETSTAAGSESSWVMLGWGAGGQSGYPGNYCLLRTRWGLDLGYFSFWW
jgi:hypothetical protein